eukprot:scaffold138486_cov139-Phaeocystis_antarctica.AAC.1
MNSGRRASGPVTLPREGGRRPMRPSIAITIASKVSSGSAPSAPPALRRLTGMTAERRRTVVSLMGTISTVSHG